MTPVPPAIPAAVFETRLPYRLGVTYRTLESSISKEGKLIKLVPNLQKIMNQTETGITLKTNVVRSKISLYKT